MKKTPLFLLFLGWSIALAAQVPANDNCADAIEVLLDEVVAFNTTEATTDGPLHLNSPCPSSDNDTLFRDIWYKFTPDFSGLANWTLCGTADFDTKIAVYKGGATCPLEDGDLLTCNDDFGTCIGNTSQIIFDVEAGQTYLLRLGGWGETAPGEAGAGTFFVEAFTPSLPNDFCAQAIDISLVQGYQFTNIDATNDGPLQPNNSACFGFGDPNVQADIWYRFTSPITGAVEWSTCDQINFDSRLAVYGPNVSCTPTGGQLYACNDDGSGCSFYTSRVVFSVQEGDTYLLRLGGWNGDQGTGTFDLQEITPPVPPGNDLCANADSAWIVTAMMADDFEGAIEGSNSNGTFDQDNFIFPNAQCFGTNTGGGEFSDVWFWINTYGNTELEFRFYKGAGSEGASFYLEMFDACDMQVDTNLLFGSCLYADAASAEAVTTVTGLPEEPTLYLLRVTTRLTTQLPGDFFFFVVGEITEPPVGTKEAFPGNYQVFPNPAGDKLYLNLVLDQPANTTLGVFNTLGQQVMTERKGNLHQGAHRFDFDVSGLEAGVYFLRLDSEQGRGMVKFVKE
jgi:hypothetical protein